MVKLKYMMRIILVSTPKYSAIPEQTPASILFSERLIFFFWVSIALTSGELIISFLWA